jgi:signal transduction histidine kinase
MRFSLRTKLLAAFAIDLLLMMALGAFANYQMARMNEKAAFVEQITIPSLDLSDKINAAITRYRSLQLEYIINNSRADKDRIEADMSQQEALMAAYFNKFEALISSDQERQTLDEVRWAWQDFVDATRNRFLPASRLNNTGTVQPAFNRLNPLYDELTSAAEQLIRESQSQATAALGVVGSSFQMGRTFILGDTIATLVLSATIGLVLSARIAARIGRLTGATREVAAGDLARKVPVVGNDELSDLARDFNAMVDSLREQRELLEQRNHELQTSLQRQQQLTDDLVRGKAAEAEAEQGRASAEAANRAKTMFLATMSHELRTPLNAILGYTQLMQLKAAMRGANEMNNELERMQAAGKHLLTLVSNILDFSKIEQGKMELDLSMVDLPALVREVSAIIEPLAHQQNNCLSVECPNDLAPFQSDSSKLRQILFNLLSNACKFTENGEIVLRVEGASLRYEDVKLRFSVSDTGIGMSTDEISRLFQPFMQADASTTRKYGGTGLGLALTQEFCHMLGGTINVESVPGVGSTFIVELPYQLPTNETHHQPAALLVHS